MAYRIIPDIETHCTELTIKGFTGFYMGLTTTKMPMTISGTVDGKHFTVKTNGNMTMGEIVDAIVRKTR